MKDIDVEEKGGDEAGAEEPKKNDPIFVPEEQGSPPETIRSDSPPPYDFERPWEAARCDGYDSDDSMCLLHHTTFFNDNGAQHVLLPVPY